MTVETIKAVDVKEKQYSGWCPNCLSPDIKVEFAGSYAIPVILCEKCGIIMTYNYLWRA